MLAAVGLGVGWSQDGDVGQFAWSFGLLNALLAVFNLLPGLPLDGGAALQSLVWAVTGRRDLGLLVAGWIGRLVAVGIVVWFLVLPLLRGATPELFDLLIGLVMAWVLWSGATAGLHRAKVERLFDTVRVGDAAAPVTVLPPETPLAVAREHPSYVLVPDETGRPSSCCGACPWTRPRRRRSGPSSSGCPTATSSRPSRATSSAAHCGRWPSRGSRSSSSREAGRRGACSSRPASTPLPDAPDAAPRLPAMSATGAEHRRGPFAEGDRVQLTDPRGGCTRSPSRPGSSSTPTAAT